MSDPIPDVDAAFDDDTDFDLPPTVDEAAVRRMEFVSQLLDESVEIPGTDFSIGLDPILGVLPVAGDVVSAALSFYIVAESARLGVSYTTLVRMIGNIAVDVGVGSVPVLGTLFDAFWKANVKNVELALEELAETTDGSADPDPVTIEVD